MIPAEGEDESSCSEDSTDEAEWRSSEDEAGEGEGEGEPDRWVLAVSSMCHRHLEPGLAVFAILPVVLYHK